MREAHNGQELAFRRLVEEQKQRQAQITERSTTERLRNQLLEEKREADDAEKKITPLVGTIDFLERILTDKRTYSQTLSKERTAERLADLVAEAHRLVIEELSARQLDTDALNVAIEAPSILQRRDVTDAT